MIAIFPEIASASVAKQFDVLGILVRSYFAGDRRSAPQLDVKSIVQSAGIMVRRGQLQRNAVGAIVAKDTAGRVEVSIILTDRPLPVAEEAFLLAHLFGHWLIHIQPAIARGEWRTSGYTEFNLPSTYFDGMV